MKTFIFRPLYVHFVLPTTRADNAMKFSIAGQVFQQSQVSYYIISQRWDNYPTIIDRHRNQ